MRRTKDIRRRGLPRRPILPVFSVTVATFCLLYPVVKPVAVTYTTEPAVQERATYSGVKIVQKKAAHQGL
jgi:hypothetical protein